MLVTLRLRLIRLTISQGVADHGLDGEQGARVIGVEWLSFSFPSNLSDLGLGRLLDGLLVDLLVVEVKVGDLNGIRN